jgi:metal-responsive CopG/Arc/MetJ family transcriptional regulator
MKTAVSIPDPLFKEAEAAAKALGLSRSKLIQAALEEFLKRRRDEEVTASINRYIEKYGADLSEEDEILLEHARQMTSRVEGEE